MDCGSLHDPENGMVVYSSTMYNNIATYKCDRDYELFGENTRTCRADGNWTESEPVCKSKLIHYRKPGNNNWLSNNYMCYKILATINVGGGGGETYGTNAAINWWFLIWQFTLLSQIAKLSGYTSIICCYLMCTVLVIGFERDSYSVNEAAGNVKICVALNLEAALTFPVERITLRVSTVEITAGT